MPPYDSTLPSDVQRIKDTGYRKAGGGKEQERGASNSHLRAETYEGGCSEDFSCAATRPELVEAADVE